jgi:hypothetical protein
LILDVVLWDLVVDSKPGHDPFLVVQDRGRCVVIHVLAELGSTSSSPPTTSSSASTFAPASTATTFTSLESLATLLLLSKELFLTFFLLSAKLFFGLHTTRLWFLEVFSVDPFGVSAMFARDDIVPVRGAGASVGTEASEVETADGVVLDVS